MKSTQIPYFCWRDGRPRWVPGPKLRAAGLKGRDLKDESGAWLSKGAAIDAAEALNKQAAAFMAGHAELPAAAERRTVGALIARYKSGKRYGKIAAATRAGYDQYLGMIERWAGDQLVAHIDGDGIENFCEEVAEERGAATANALLRTIKLLLNFGVKKLEWLSRNRAVGVEFHRTDGRRVMWTPEEVEAFVACADWLGVPAQGDAVMLAVLTAQRKADLLTLPEVTIEQARIAIKQRKRGRMAFVPLTAPLIARLEDMRRRKREKWPNVAFHHELIAGNGKPYDPRGGEFGYEFRAVRAIAAGGLDLIPPLRAQRTEGAYARAPFRVQPGLNVKTFADLRDTAVTWLCAAGCTIPEIANISGHSLKTVQTLLDEHYFVRNAELATSAGVKLDAYLATKGMGR